MQHEAFCGYLNNITGFCARKWSFKHGLVQLRIKDELELWFSNKGGHSDADWLNLSEAEKITKWITERCSKLNASVFAKEDYSAVKNYQQEAQLPRSPNIWPR